MDLQPSLCSPPCVWERLIRSTKNILQSVLKEQKPDDETGAFGAPTKFLGVHISEDLSWTTNTASLAKKAQRRLYFLRKLRRASAPPSIMTTFYRGTIESIITSCIAVWGGSCTEYNRKALQRIVNTAGRIIGASLPSLKDI